MKTASDQMPVRNTVDADEIALFSTISDEWWDPKGPMMPLHRVMPSRMFYMRQQIAEHHGIDPDKPKPLSGLTVVDIGCGGGLVSEALARLGATVTGIDPTDSNIRVAKAHAHDSELTIEYLAARVEDLAAQGRKFDAVVCLEVVEHVADVEAFVSACADLVKPGGVSIMSTVNRTPLAFLLMIVAVEYVFRWIPRGTHHYDKFVTPDELAAALAKGGMTKKSSVGLKYNPRTEVFKFTKSLDVSYFMTAAKPA